MKILHINAYTNSNNLTFPHYPIHKTLTELGHESKILSFSGDLYEDNIYYVKKQNKNRFFKFKTGIFNLSKVARIIFFKYIKKDIENEYYYYPEWNLNFLNVNNISNELNFKPDVIICYWTKFFFNTKFIYDLSKTHNSLVFYYLMDMAPITGGCHYSNSCTNYFESCGKCPALKSNRENDLSRKTLLNNARLYEMINPIAIFCSKELKNQLFQSSLWRDKRKYEIILGVNENVFSSFGRENEREKLGIKKNQRVILYGAASIKNKRKGYNIFIDSLKLLELYDNNLENLLVIFIGKDLPQINLSINFLNLGYLNSELELAKAYKVADIFVSSSIEDSGPIMVNQSIMTGTPVVAFDVGVSQNLIFNHKTGYIANEKTPNSLSNAILEILTKSDNQLNKMRQLTREFGLNHFTNKIQAEKLINIIEENLNR